MPSAQKVTWAKLRVGVMAIIAMSLLGLMIFLLTSDTHFFSKQAKIYTYMDDAAALTKGASVRLNGIVIGKVTEVALSGETAPKRIIKIHMEVENKNLLLIPVDSIASLSAENVLGVKFLNIKKGQSSITVQEGAEIQSLDTREFDEVVQQGYSLLSSLQGIVKRVDAIVGLIEVGKGSIGKLLVDEELYNRVIDIVGQGQKITSALSSNKGTIGKLIYDETLYNDVRGSLGRLDTVLADIQAGKGTAGKFLKDEALYTESRQTIAELRRTITDLNTGKGTAGKLLKDDALYNELRASLDRVDLMLDKINAGQGTIGQLLVNPQLYDSVNGTTRELHELFKDFRANPKKFLRIKLAIF